MIDADGVDDREAREIVLVGDVVAPPGHDVERRVIDTARVQPSAVLCREFEVALTVLEGRDRRHEVARVREPVRTHEPALRQRERLAVVLADVAARGAVEQHDAEHHTARHDGDLARSRLQHAAFRVEPEPALLRHDEQFAVRIEEEAVGHRLVGEVKVYPDAHVQPCVAVGAERHETVDPVRGRLRNREGVPAKLRRRNFGVLNRPGAQEILGFGLEAAVPHRGTDSVEPVAPVAGARRRKRRAAELLGIEPIGRTLRRPPADRQRSGQRLALALVAEAVLVFVFVREIRKRNWVVWTDGLHGRRYQHGFNIADDKPLVRITYLLTIVNGSSIMYRSAARPHHPPRSCPADERRKRPDQADGDVGRRWLHRQHTVA